MGVNLLICGVAVLLGLMVIGAGNALADMEERLVDRCRSLDRWRQVAKGQRLSLLRLKKLALAGQAGEIDQTRLVNELLYILNGALYKEEAQE